MHPTVLRQAQDFGDTEDSFGNAIHMLAAAICAVTGVCAAISPSIDIGSGGSVSMRIDRPWNSRVVARRWGRRVTDANHDQSNPNRVRQRTAWITISPD